ncbi:hypothetical protein LIER_21974 [Lithospermum erythrorhizon]|uniref:Reverse transcriptase RNase H-like domain-containing protein n=1 Tax=Lithospermum erythrorhizon TaxID=34254 RepID=A0AAV3QS48_LITER
MCTDFACINKACPKDCYPLPNIDRLVDSSVGFNVVDFLDAFRRYQQIFMPEEDMRKTTFVTEYDIYCWKVMAFGLKNVGATYQRMINKSVEDRSQSGQDSDGPSYIDPYDSEGGPAANRMYCGLEAVHVTGRRVMRGAETRYPLMEKLVFALIVAAWKLKTYIKAHKIEVITNQPLRQILENSSRSGRIVKWVIDLGEFDPRYKLQTSIKAQALLDFVVECTHEPVEEAPELINLIEASQDMV